VADTKQLAKTDLKALLAAVDGSYVEAYKRLMAATEAEIIAVSKRSTKADRRDRWSKALAKLDRGALAKINKQMQTYLRVVRNQTITAAEEPRALTEPEAQDLMGEYLALRDITEFLDVRKAFMKSVVQAHVAEEAAAAGEAFPHNVNGSIEVPALGQQFCIEGSGWKPVTPDHDKLQEIFADVWDEITDVEIIPEQVVRTLNIEKLMATGRLEDIRKALPEELEPKTQRFVVRPIPPITER